VCAPALCLTCRMRAIAYLCYLGIARGLQEWLWVPAVGFRRLRERPWEILRETRGNLKHRH
jgi:hypothetical protein